MNESTIMRQVMIKASKLGWRLFRTQVGLSWAGERIPAPIAYGKRAVLLLNARPIKTGVRGMSDTIGWRTVVITPDMVGKKFALYVAREIKTPTGRCTDEQINFLATVNLAGGDGAVCRSADDLCAGI